MGSGRDGGDGVLSAALEARDVCANALVVDRKMGPTRSRANFFFIRAAFKYPLRGESGMRARRACRRRLGVLTFPNAFRSHPAGGHVVAHGFVQRSPASGGRRRGVASLGYI